MTVAAIIAHVLSAYTLLAMALAGSKPRIGWALALAGQPLWMTYSWLSTDGMGLLPLSLGLCLVYTRNLWRATCKPGAPSQPHPYPPTWRETWARRTGLWGLYGRASLIGWAWAKREIPLTHPRAPEVSYRYAQLKEEFSK